METADRAFGFSRGDATVRLGLEGAERRREDGDGRRRLLCERMGRLGCGGKKTEGEEEWRSAGGGCCAANGEKGKGARRTGGRKREKRKEKNKEKKIKKFSFSFIFI